MATPAELEEWSDRFVRNRRWYFYALGLVRAYPVLSRDAADTAQTLIHDAVMYVRDNEGGTVANEGHFCNRVVWKIRRLVIDQCRRQSTQQFACLPLMDPDVVDLGSHHESVVAERDERAHREAILSRALDRLTLRDRMLLRLKFYLGWTFEEIDEYYGTALGTAANHVYRAVKRLRDAVQQIAQERDRGD